MTQKEKAIELVNKFKQYSWSSYTEGFEESSLNDSAKKCALITVDEIMNVCPFIGIDFATSEGGKESDAKEYWQQVKQEIEKL